MDLLKALEPYKSELDAFEAGHGFTSREKIAELAPIWQEFAQDNVKEIYGSARHVVELTDLACGSCVKDMLKMLTNWRNILKNDMSCYYKMVPDGKPKISKKDGAKTTTEDTKVDEGDDISKMKWGELTAKAKELEISTYRKKRPQLEAEVREALK